MKIRFWVYLLLPVAFFSCTADRSGFRIEVDFVNAPKGSVYLYRLSRLEEPQFVDSFVCTQLDEKFVLKDTKAKDTAVYQVLFPASQASLYLVSDMPVISLKLNGVVPMDYSTEGSRESKLLENLQHRLNPLHDSLYILNNKIINQIGEVTRWRRDAAWVRDQIFQHTYSFIDTVGSPTIALFLIGQVDLTTDLSTYSAFVEKLTKRFPNNPQVKFFAQEANEYLSLLEIEYQVGDTLPALTLMDRYAATFSIPSPSIRYILLEFWSGYCFPCLQRLDQLKPLYGEMKRRNMELIAISLDAVPEFLNERLAEGAYPWPIIADLKGWRTQAVLHYKIDSIPCNLLVDEQGILLDKNISAAELDKFLKQL